MKMKFFSGAFFVLTLLFTACEKENNNKPIEEEPLPFTFEAQRNKNNFNTTVGIATVYPWINRLSFSALYNDKTLDYNEEIHIEINTNNLIIEDTINNFEVSYSHGSGDTRWNSHDNSNNPEVNFIIISEFDTTNHFIAGTFEFKLLLSGEDSTIVELKHGYFEFNYSEAEY